MNGPVPAARRRRTGARGGAAAARGAPPPRAEGPRMDEHLCRVGDVDLCYETIGDPANPTIAHVDPRGAHVVGVSLGSMVTQEVAIRHPDRTRSLVSIMGRPGDRRTGKVSWRRIPDFLRPPAADPVEGMVASFRRIGAGHAADGRPGTRPSVGVSGNRPLRGQARRLQGRADVLVQGGVERDRRPA